MSHVLFVTSKVSHFLLVTSTVSHVLLAASSVSHVPGVICAAGGCREDLRPASVLLCDPPCHIPGSACVDTNLCGCLGLLLPVYSANRTLIDCIMNASSTTPVPTASLEPGELCSCLG